MADNKNVTLYINTKGAQASLRELTSDSNKLRNELAKLEPTSKEFIEKSKDFSKVNTRLKAVRQDMNGVKQEMDFMGKGFAGFRAGLVAAFSFGAILEAGKALWGFFTDGIKKNAELNKSLSDLRAITGVSKDELKFFGKEARKASDETGIAAKDIVEAYKLIGSAKPELLANKDALAAITKEALILAEASGMALPAAASSLTDALNQFSAPAEQAGRYINVLAAGSQEGAAEIPQITEALLKFGLQADSSNVSIEESTALIEVLADRGEKGAEAGTKLRNVLLNLANAEGLPQKALDAFEKAGIDIDKLSDKTIPLSDRLREASKLLESGTGLLDVFGKENVIAAQSVLQNINRFDELTVALTGTNTAYVQASQATDNLSHDYEVLTTQIVNSQMAMGDSSDSALRDITQFATEIVKNTEPVGDAFSSVGSTIGRVLSSLGRLINMLLPFNTKADGAATIMKTLGTAIKTLFLPLEAFLLGVGLLIDSLNLLWNTGKKVANFFGAEFEIDRNASLSKLGSNLLDSTKEIATGYADIWIDSDKKIIDSHTQRYNELIALEKNHMSLGDHLAEEKKKKEEEANKAFLERRKQFMAEESARIGSGSSGASGPAAPTLSDAEIKEREAAAEHIKKLEMDILGDTLEEKIQKLRLQAKKEIEELKGSEEQKRKQRVLINKRTNSDIDKLNQAHRDHELKEAEKQAQAEADLKLEAERIYAEKEKASAFAKNDIALILAGGNEARILDIKLDRLALEKQYELENKELTETEKLAIEYKYQDQAARLREDARQQNLAKTQQDVSSALQYSATAVNIISDFQNAKHQRELTDIDEQYQVNLNYLDRELANKKISQKEYDRFRKEAEVNHSKDLAKVKKKQFQSEQIAAIAQATIQTALSVMQAAASAPYPANIPLMVAAGVIGAAQIAIIASQPVPQFAEGGSTKRAMKFATELPTVSYGGYIDQPLIAEFGEEGPEYVVPNWMMQDPMIGDMVGMMENIRSGKSRKGFAVGGPTQGTVPSTGSGASGSNIDAMLMQLIGEIRGLRSDVRTSNKNLKAYIAFQELEDAFDTVEEIRNESKLQ